MDIVNVKVSKIKPYERNAKKHSSEQVDQIANSIKEFGFKQPLVVDRNNVLIIGHGRLLAAKRLGLQEVPCLIAEDLTEDQVRALRLADNKTNESPWDEQLLNLDLLDLDFDMSMFGFLDEEPDGETGASGSKNVVKAMELKAFEHHDYIVFVFKNQFDWLNAVNAFGLEKVNAGYGSTKKIGLGRVIDGKRLLEKIEYQDSNFEPWESTDDNDN